MIEKRSHLESNYLIYIIIFDFILAIISLMVFEEFKNTKEIIRIRTSTNRQDNGQTKKDKQRYTKHYTEN